MFGDLNNDVEKNRSIMALLIEMARADNTLNLAEGHYITMVSQQLGIGPEELALIQNKPEQFPFVIPESEQERMTILYYVLFTMRSDGEIKKEEESICHKVGLKLGFNPALTQDLIRVMKTYAKQEIPPDAMIDQIKKYLN